MAKSRDMRLRIVACQQIYSGLNPKGHRYTIFDIEAAKADGSLIDEKLRAFEALKRRATACEPVNWSGGGRSSPRAGAPSWAW